MKLNNKTKNPLIIDCTTSYQPDTGIPFLCKRCGKFHFEGVKLGITNPCAKLKIVNNFLSPDTKDKFYGRIKIMVTNLTCWQNEGNRLCTDGKHTYHQWNIYHSDKCNFCNTKRWFKTKTCPICEKSKEIETDYCECKRCEKCGKFIK